MQGDAEHLPLADSTFDVVIGIESAPAYPDVQAFYREARRVLRAGGRFLCTDSIAPDALATRTHALVAARFSLLDRRDLTPNILCSCDERAHE